MPRRNNRFGKAKRIPKAIRDALKPKRKKRTGPSVNQQAFERVKQFCIDRGFPIPVGELEFAKESHGRKWRLDCAWPEIKLAMEFMGSVWSGGRHTTGDGYTKDSEKICHLCILGWRYMQVTTQQLKKGLAEQWLNEFFQRNQC